MSGNATLSERLGKDVASFWKIRGEQEAQQGEATGNRDRGGRTAVTGGRHFDAFADLVGELLSECGIPDASIFHARRMGQQKRTELPGFFRATKQWDLVAVVDDQLVATIEFKSQVGPSFGNNVNNRAEEAVGNAVDILTAYREGALPIKPWLGFFALLEEADASTSPVRIREPHFNVFPEFRESSYAARWELLCRKLVRENLYDAACFILSDAQSGPRGHFVEPSKEVSFERFAASLMGTAMSVARLRGDR